MCVMHVCIAWDEFGCLKLSVKYEVRKWYTGSYSGKPSQNVWDTWFRTLPIASEEFKMAEKIILSLNLDQKTQKPKKGVQKIYEPKWKNATFPVKLP